MHEHELTKTAVVKGQILAVATLHDQLGDSGQKTGLWISELAEPYYVFREAGYDVTIASPKGGPIPIDAASLEGDFYTAEAKRFLEADDAAKLQLEHSVKLDDVTEPEAYDAIFLPGGHGPVFDLAKSEKLGELLTKAYAAGKVVCAVCHGPAGLVTAKDGDKPLVAGKKVTGFSNSEERAVGKDKYVPFLLEDKLKELGGKYEAAGDWQPHVVQDGRLITGQNPSSSKAMGEAVVAALEKSKAA